MRTWTACVKAVRALITLRPLYAHRPASALVMRQRLRRLLPIGYVELTEIPRNALLKLCPAPLHLSACEVPIAVVHRF
jgi:hypothetical protein